MSTTKHSTAVWKLSAIAASLALASALTALPAAAQGSDAARTGHHARMHHAHIRVMDSYAAYGAEPDYVGPGWDAPYYGQSYGVYGYNCGIGLYNTPLACAPGD